MGNRGPKPLPSNVHRLRGNPSRLSPGQLRDSVEPEIEIPGCPKHLLPEARKEWKRITPELQQLGLVAEIDRASLALYCQEWAWWAWHDSLLQRDIKIIAQKRAEHEADTANADKPWVGGDGFMIPTPNGSFTYNPHWVGRNKAAERLDKFLASFGMSPSSRGRVTPSSRQIPLPGMGEAPKGGFEVM